MAKAPVPDTSWGKPSCDFGLSTVVMVAWVMLTHVGAMWRWVTRSELP